MIKVTYGTTLKRESKIVEKTTTLRAFLEEVGQDYTKGTMTLDGSALNPGDLDRTFASFNLGDKCFLMSVVKADNAA